VEENMKRTYSVAIVTSAIAVAFAAGAWAGKDKPQIAVTPAGDIKWSPLDPKAGDKGPQMTVVFGDPKKGPVGVLVKFPPGAKPGPHTHSSDYWAVVVSGNEHDFSPGAEEGKAIGPGGFWFQPAKMAHDNHCEDGAECVVFIYMPHAFDMKPVTGKAE
jgi:hypothetical protein